MLIKEANGHFLRKKAKLQTHFEFKIRSFFVLQFIRTQDRLKLTSKRPISTGAIVYLALKRSINSVPGL